MSWVRSPSPAPSKTLADKAFRRSATDLAFPTFLVTFPIGCSGPVLRDSVRHAELGDLARFPDRATRVAKRCRNLCMRGSGPNFIERGPCVFCFGDSPCSRIHVPDVIRDTCDLYDK